VSTHSINKVVKATIDWAFDKSDHALVKIDLIVNSGMTVGPGIIKVNTKILNSPDVTRQVGEEIEIMMSQTDDNWNPHSRLEFLKVAIRTVFSSKVSEIRKTINNDMKDIEDEVNQYEELRIRTLSKKNISSEEKVANLAIIDKAITALRIDLCDHRKKRDDTMAFVSRTKWFEYGEKSNSFFLGLAKSRQNQKIISKIVSNGKEFNGQKEVSNGISEFYEELYSARNNKKESDESFYSNCPKLTNEQMNFLETELSIEELHKALLTCKESSPGPDGIPYQIYKTYWKIMGPTIHKAWLYSVKTGIMPPSHLESMITLLPKEGKDIGDIKNWRPITLSNCDSKIITKAISLKAAKVLESIIDPSQTAYIPGRSVSDNLRSNFFLKKYCKENNINATLVSLDAKKAFDSVDHEYIKETLKAYGFGPKFIRIFETLYNKITAKILINGFASEAIKIERGVKQGDALSCAIFIICIDPLLRNLNKNRNIKGIRIRKKNGKDEGINFKSSAYADDISVICEGEDDSIQNIFLEYERLTRKSGLELNADKTEILKLNNPNNKQYNIKYYGKRFQILTVNRIKICGLFYCSAEDDEHKLNVDEKIVKLQNKMKLWTHRHLSMEGKTLIVKTFGLSQVIYNMQSYEFKKEDLTNIERLIFKFLWSTSENPNGIDRIKRSIMKNEHSKGGMKVTDVECLNRSLKLRQFIRARETNHEISKIQNLLTNGNINIHETKQEFFEITECDPICKTAQETINIIIDFCRDKYKEITHEKYENDRHLINEVASLNLATYLHRKNYLLTLCMLKTLTRRGILTLGELVQSYEYENDKKIQTTMKSIMATIPKHLISIAKCYNDDINSCQEELKHLLIDPEKRKDLRTINVKEIQILLKML
jgi:hypothetical protein